MMMIDRRHFELFKLAQKKSSFKQDQAKLIEEFSEFITAINRTENILFDGEVIEEFSDLLIMSVRMLMHYSTPENKLDFDNLLLQAETKIFEKIERQIKRWEK